VIKRAILGGAALALSVAGFALGQTPPAGPPFPAPELNRTVYDFANILAPETEASLTASIARIERQTASEVVVYTQYKPGSSDESTDEDGRTLITQWGVGRRGFDDGLAIMWNTTRPQCLSGVSGNGRVRLYAAPGYQAAYASNAERQEIFENEMLPHLQACDEDAAILAAMGSLVELATPEHAAKLQLARQIDAAVGLVGGPLAFVFLVGAAAWSWVRYGKDPVYLDDPSIHIPAPPPDLTAASGAVVWEGRATRRALTTAMLDLASRGEIGFREESGLLGLGGKKAGIQIATAPSNDPNVIRNRRRPLSEAENYALGRVNSIASPGGRDGYYIAADEVPKFGKYTASFDTKIEKHVTSMGWFREPPQKAIARWRTRGFWIAALGAVALFVGLQILPSNGFTILGGFLLAAGIVIMGVSAAMPARTMAGAMIYAMLAAYRRTLEKTMAQARSMQQVVAEAHLPWLETPDQSVVWGTALGLQSDIEQVLMRTAEDAQSGVSRNAWFPAWYGSSSSGGGLSGGQAGLAPGLFSSGGIPDFGGMMSALGTIGSSPSSSGSGGSGGFSGGGGGGGGGGAGGGY
jgi:uncharacterized membrane protein YgcG